MKSPKRLKPLLDDGIIDSVERQLMSGKEATVYAVRCGDELRCAKVYKEADKRSFRQAVQYQEGRKGRNSRRTRAMEKRSNYGRQQQESAWHNAEVDALYRLERAGVRVPKPYGCFDGVLLMALITDADGSVAPRLSEVSMTSEEALAQHGQMMNYVVRMLDAGLVHGDLSPFNVLVDDAGPVVIDLPQAVDAAANNHAQAMLARDVGNMTEYYGQFSAELNGKDYAGEIWALYEAGELHPDTVLTGSFVASTTTADVEGLMLDIESVLADEERRQQALQAAETGGEE